MASDSIKFYGLVYVALVLLATVKFVFFELDHIFTYWDAVAGTLVAAGIKSTLIVAYYQHLRWENRWLTYLMVTALALGLLLMSAASYSIT